MEINIGLLTRMEMYPDGQIRIVQSWGGQTQIVGPLNADVLIDAVIKLKEARRAIDSGLAEEKK
jgi:hypothetical protein